MKTSDKHGCRSIDPQELLRDFARLYGAAKLDGGGVKAASLDERVSRSKPGSSYLTFGRELPTEVRMAHSFARWLDVWEREVNGGGPGVNVEDKRSEKRKAQTAAILGEVGLDPTAVAFVYGMTTQGVRQLRGRHGRDPDTGQRVTELRAERIDGRAPHQAPLTAPGSNALKRLEERHADGEVGQ